MNKVIVIGGNHHNTLGVVRGLGEKGIKSNLIIVSDDNNSFVTKSKYLEKKKIISNLDELSDLLLMNFVSDGQLKPILIACSDAVSGYIDMHRFELEFFFILPGCGMKDSLNRLMNKVVMEKVAKDIGFLIPTQWEQPYEFSKIKYPCITKPLISLKSNKNDIAIHYNEESLCNYITKNKHSKFIIQDYVDKKEEIQLIGCSLKGGIEVIIPGMTHILRSEYNTNTGFLKYTSISDFYQPIVELCKIFIQKCNYSGLFSIEFIRDKIDNVYFLEINFRNDGNAYSVTSAGVNLPYIWVKSNSGFEITDEDIPKPKEIYVMPEFQDFKLVINRKLSIINWLKDVFRTNTFLVFNKKDMRPFYSKLYNAFMHLFR